MRVSRILLHIQKPEQEKVTMNIQEFNELRNDEKEELLEAVTVFYWVKRGIIGALIISILLMAGCPQYNVWEQGLTGQAELARAEQNRQIAIEEALAKKESAQHEADAEAIRATGVKAANQTIAEGLGGPEGYLRYLYINALQATSCETIYVPTEAGLPIMEATRRMGGL